MFSESVIVSKPQSVCLADAPVKIPNTNHVNSSKERVQ